MIWRSHMVLGASSWLTAQGLASQLTGPPLSSTDRACGAVIAAGAALVCDLDTPTSRLAHTLGPITRLVARAIGRVFGGHRRGTHSLAFCATAAAVTAVAITQTQVIHFGPHVVLSTGQLAALTIGFLATALTVGALLPLRGGRAALVTVALVATGASARPSPGLVSSAVAIGCLSHLLGDCLTTKGITPLWPFSDRCVSLPLIKRTGDVREHTLVLAIAAVTVAILGGFS